MALLIWAVWVINFETEDFQLNILNPSCSNVRGIFNKIISSQLNDKAYENKLETFVLLYQKITGG